jgi:hypothetical protein
MSMQAAMEALTKDAGRWGKASDTLERASENASALALPSLAFPQLLGIDGLDLDGKYQDLRQKVARLCAEGSTETEQLGAALRKVRRDFESTDQSVRDALNGLWEVK